MEMLFALAMPFMSSQARARFRRRLQSFEADSPDATDFSTDGLPFHLDNEDAEELGRAAQCSTHIESFHLDVTGITPSGCSTLVDFFRISPILATVMLEGDLDTPFSKRQTAQVTNRLLAAMQMNPSITSVKLSSSHFSTGSIENLLRSENCSLRKLVLLNCWSSCTPVMSNAMARAINKNSSLEDVTLSALNTNLMATLLRDGLADHETVKRLYLGTVEPTVGAAVRVVLDSTTDLNTLSIGRAHLTAQNLQPIVAGLVTRSCTVRVFGVHQCHLDASAVAQLKTLFRSSNGNMQEITLSESISSTAMLAEITQSLHRNTAITFLDISKCFFDPRLGARHIRDLMHRNRHMTRLDIDRNQLGPAGATEIANGLMHNRTLRHLDVSICDLGDVGAILLTAAVATHPTLSHLVMCGNDITKTGIDFFVRTMTQLDEQPKLEHLILNMNTIGDEGAFLLAALLRRSNSLKALHVAHCGLTGEGFAALMVGLKENTGLLRLDADEIEVGDTLPEQASHALAECLPFLSLKNLSVTGGDLPTGLDCDSAEQQDRLLKGFESNTSLQCISIGAWFLDDVRRHTMAYYILRNTILPLINQDNAMPETAVSATTAASIATPDGDAVGDTSEETPLPPSVWPHVFAYLDKQTHGASAIFFALTSRPDLVVSESILEAASPSPVNQRKRRRPEHCD